MLSVYVCLLLKLFETAQQQEVRSVSTDAVSLCLSVAETV